MPLSDWLQTRKIDSTLSKMTNCSSNVSSFMPDNDFVELLWENGQIVMQGQSNRPRTSSFSTPFSTHAGRLQEKDGRDTVTPKLGRFEEMESMVNDFSPPQPEGDVGLNADDDDMVPWIHYPIEDSLQNDYCSDFLPEISGVNLNFPSADNNAASIDRSTEFVPTVRSSHNVEHGYPSKDLAGSSGSDTGRTNQLFPAPQQCPGSIPGVKPRTAELGSRSSNVLGARLPKQDLTAHRALQPGGSSSSTGLLNFSHFSRPAALAKANLHGVDRLRSHEKASASASSNLVESTIIQSASCRKSVSEMQGQVGSVPSKLELRSPHAKPPQVVLSVEQSVGICQEDWSRKNSGDHAADDSNVLPDHMNNQSSSIGVKRAGGRQETHEKGAEAVVAASSVCSGNSGGTASNDPKHGEKRKHHEEDSSNHSDDLEDESVGQKKPATLRSTSTKRSRAAEVHNLSERKRRDRINEKMRALQELIPNCNKVDKASMLDEAIEYLKTLQLQVQMMSMASGLCMSPMMLPAGMPHMRMPHMAHFSQIGAGMGMGMGMRLGYGMGMLDMNGSPGCPLIPVPPMHGPQFPCPSVPGAQGLHGLPGSAGLPMFGIPGQALPMPMPRGPSLACLSAGLPAQVNSAREASGTTSNPLPAPIAAPLFSSKDQQQQCMNLETIQKASADGSQIQTSSKGTKESYKEPALVQTGNQMLLVSTQGGINSTSENGTTPARTTSFG